VTVPLTGSGKCLVSEFYMYVIAPATDKRPAD